MDGWPRRMSSQTYRTDYTDPHVPHKDHRIQVQRRVSLLYIRVDSVQCFMFGSLVDVQQNG